MSVKPASDFYRDSYVIRAKDAAGKEQYYSIELYQLDENGKEKQISLTINQWQQAAQELQPAFREFLGSAEAIPKTFDVAIQKDALQLTAKNRPDMTRLLHEGDPSVPKICAVFRHIVYGSDLKAPIHFSVDQFEIPRPIPGVGDDDLKLNPAAAPIGIHNEGNDCFISAYLQAFILNDEELMQALWKNREGGTAEIGRFLYFYAQAVLKNEKGIYGIHHLRDALIRANGTEYKTGQHDSLEAFLFLQDPKKFAGFPYFQEEGKINTTIWTSPTGKSVPDTRNPEDFTGTLIINYQNGQSLEQSILASLHGNDLQKTHDGEEVTGKKTVTLIRPSKHLMVPITNPDRKPITSVNKILEIPKDHFLDDEKKTYQLTSFIQHRGQDNKSGHYVAYVLRGDKYFECNDSVITELSKEVFLDAAKTASAVGYTLT